MIEPTAVVHRLDELRADVSEGERALRELDAQREQLVATLLRLSGAVQVLEELLPARAAPEHTARP
jgi:ABC-type transporter Mla subunit MlaD